MTAPRFLSWAALALLLVIAVNMLLPVMQLFVIGRVIMPSVVVKIALAGVLAGALFVQYRRYGREAFTVDARLPWLRHGAAFTLVFTALAVVLYAGGTPAKILAHSYGGYYFMLLIFPMMILAGIRLEWRAIERALLWTGAAAGLLGILQGLLQVPVIPVSIQLRGMDASAMFYGHMRAFSLFLNPYSFGLFMSLIWMVVLAAMAREGARGFPWKYAPIAAITLAALAFSLNRNAWLQTALSTAFFFMVYKRPGWRALRRYAPLLLFVAFGLAAFLVANVDALLQQSVFSNESLGQRIYQWGIYLDVWMHGTPLQWCTGMGIFQHRDYIKIIIDSTYVAVMVHTGMLGLLAVLYFFSWIWTYAERRFAATLQPHTLGILAFLAPFPIVLMMQIELVYYPFAVMLLAMGEER